MTADDLADRLKQGSAPSETQTPADPTVPPGDGQGLWSHFVRRTDNDFHGVRDESLIGHDLPDEEDEDEDDKNG